ncbi:MAG TPA: rhomboid family intramembrane serine protease [Phycisphaerales bacterium]|nr:rhomboid family intramembrane serine protease [Phycisphaerales bacterium]
MGIHDRDYARAKGSNRWGAGGDAGRSRGGGGPHAGGGGGSARWNPRTWSMTAWLVVINIAIALIGVVLLTLPGDRGWEAYPVTVRWVENIPSDAKAFATPDPRMSKRQLLGTPEGTEVSLFDSRTSRHIGMARFVPMGLDQVWGHFSTFKAFGQYEVWRFITFQFLHQYGWIHLAFNMIGLWTFGPDVEEYLGRKRFLALYLTCGVFGALAYLLLNGLGNLLPAVQIPGLLIHDTRTPLVGASAGIFGIMLAAAFIVPQRVIDLLYLIPIRIKPAVYLFFGIALINLLIGKRNTGGEAAHVGGALAGYYFIRHMYLLRDFFDFFGPAEKGAPGAATVNQEELDRVLAKVHQHGKESLDEEERLTLERATLAARGGKARTADEGRA